MHINIYVCVRAYVTCMYIYVIMCVSNCVCVCFSLSLSLCFAVMVNIIVIPFALIATATKLRLSGCLQEKATGSKALSLLLSSRLRSRQRRKELLYQNAG